MRNCAECSIKLPLGLSNMSMNISTRRGNIRQYQSHIKVVCIYALVQYPS